MFSQVEDNVPIRKIMEAFINPRTGKPFSHSMFYHWVRLDPERQKTFKEIRAVGAFALMDDIDELLDEADDKFMTPASVSLLKERIGQKRWLAEKYNPEAFGKADDGPAVQLNFDAAWLDALQAHGSAKTLPTEPLEAEVVEDGEKTLIPVGTPEGQDELWFGTDGAA